MNGVLGCCVCVVLYFVDMVCEVWWKMVLLCVVLMDGKCIFVDGFYDMR